MLVMNYLLVSSMRNVTHLLYVLDIVVAASGVLPSFVCQVDSSPDEADEDVRAASSACPTTASHHAFLAAGLQEHVQDSAVWRVAT